MFPLNWNIPFIRKNGSRTTLGAITGDIAGIEEDVTELTDKAEGLWDNMMDNGAVNIAENTAVSTTASTITYTVNSDKTITANAGSAPSSPPNFNINTDILLKAGKYKLTGCPSGGANNTYRLQIYTLDGTTAIAIDTGDGKEFELSSDTHVKMTIRVQDGYQIQNKLFKPMISLASLNLSYDDYVPYAMTNRELTEDTITQTDVTFTPDTTKVTVKNTNLYREGKHIRGRLDLQVVDTAGGTLGTFNKTAAYITPMYAYVGDRTTIDNQPAYSYINGTSLVINPISAFVANDRIQVAVDFYTA